MAVTTAPVSVTKLVSTLRQHRQAAAGLRASSTGRDPGPVASRLVESSAFLSSAYLIMAEHVLQRNLDTTSNRAERALTHYGLGLIALSKRDQDSLLRIGRELVGFDAIGRNYMNLLLSEPDVHPRVRRSWTTLLQQHEAGLDRSLDLGSR
jgi:hypothetical protein